MGAEGKAFAVDKNRFNIFDPVMCLLKPAINSQKIFGICFNIAKIFCEFIADLDQQRIVIKDSE